MHFLLKRIRAQKGYTLVELLVVVAILGLLATASFTIVVSIASLTARSAQIEAQTAAVETVFGFMGSRLAVTQPGAQQIGFTKSGSGRWLEGNDLFFKSAPRGDNGSGTSLECYRFNYNSSTRVLKVAVGTSSACNAGTALEKWENSFSNIESLAAQNGSNIKIYTLAQGVVPQSNSSGATIPEDTCQKDTPGALDGGSIFSYGGYAGNSGDSVTDITVALAACPYEEPSMSVKVSPKFFTQQFSVGQLCLIGGGTGGTPDDNSVGPAQISDFPVADSGTLGGDSVASSATSGSWYKVTVPSSFGDSLWKLTPGFYNFSAQATFSWAATTAPASTDGAAIAIVKNGNILAASSTQIIGNDAYASVSTGANLVASDSIDIWVRTTGSTPSRFQSARITGTWQN